MRCPASAVTAQVLHVEQVQAEVLEIAEVLQCEQPDKSISELWEEALSLHRVRDLRRGLQS
jgi:hypothetical protein